MSTVSRFSIEDADRYWRGHEALARAFDAERDPDGLSVSCHTRQPMWLNRHYARGQRRLFLSFLERIPRPSPRARALDVGCGAGRWSRILADRGYAVTGIDVQSALLERNRQRFPDIAFECVSVVDYADPVPFDLVTSVTVLNTLPFEAQRRAVMRIRGAVKPGSHVLLLENVLDQDVHVFANSIAEWAALFGQHGFELVARQRYDYSPAMRAQAAVRRVARAWLGSASLSAPIDRSRGVTRSPIRPPLVRAISGGVKFGAVCVDALLEPALVAVHAPLPTVHAAMLFRYNA